MTVTMATFMEVLDSSIANVSLPHIAGSLGATYDEAIWVLTSYLVSAAIVLPASGWLSTVFGRKRFYMTCVVLFTVSSFLCGIAPMPSAAERKQVFSIQLNKRKRNPADYDLDRVAEAAQGFSGAEIESAVQTALYAAFARKQELSTEDLLTALSSTVPLSVTRAEEIATLHDWAKDRAVWASAPEGRRENT